MANDSSMRFNKDLVELGQRIDHGVSLRNRLDSDRGNAKYTDLQIVCSLRVFNVHRVVIGTASEYFEAMIGGCFKEAGTGVIDLTHVPVQHIELLLNYIYCGGYDRQHPITTHIAMYTLADEYRIPNFKAKIAECVKELLEANTDDVCDMIILAVDLLWHKPAPEDTEIRRPVMEAAVKHKTELMRKVAFRILAHKGGDFAVKLLDGGYLIPWGGDYEVVKENLEDEGLMEQV
ncbi:hypothetical protein MMC18_009584 [Xylographa bjoerkii]|nr:hypothetical protein [Xylographa bjoerkii]